jgi:hypothetical protein
MQCCIPRGAVSAALCLYCPRKRCARAPSFVLEGMVLRLLFNGCIIRDGVGCSQASNIGVLQSVFVCGAFVLVLIVCSLNIGGEGASSDPHWMFRPGCCKLGMHHCVVFDSYWMSARRYPDVISFLHVRRLRLVSPTAWGPQAFRLPWPRSPRSEGRNLSPRGCNKIRGAPARREELRARPQGPRLQRNPRKHHRRKQNGIVR